MGVQEIALVGGAVVLLIVVTFAMSWIKSRGDKKSSS